MSSAAWAQVVSALVGGVPIPVTALTKQTSSLFIVELFEDLEGPIELDFLGVGRLDVTHFVRIGKCLLGGLMIKDVHIGGTL